MEELDLTRLRDRPHWSASSINALLNVCSLQWAFSHVYEVEPAFTPPNLVFGKTFHAACTYHAAMQLRGRTSSADDLAECFSDNWQTNVTLAEPGVRFDDGKGSDVLRDKGCDMIRAWHASLDPAEQIVAVANPFVVPLVADNGEVMEKPLIGELDLVVQVNGQLVVVDWKTAAHRWATDKAHKELQPVCYLHAAEDYWPDQQAVFRFDVVTKQKTPVVERYVTVRTRSDYERFCRMVEVLEHVVEQELFLPAEQSFYCKGCPYQNACAKWHQQQFTTRSLPAAA